MKYGIYKQIWTEKEDTGLGVINYYHTVSYIHVWSEVRSGVPFTYYCPKASASSMNDNPILEPNEIPISNCTVLVGTSFDELKQREKDDDSSITYIGWEQPLSDIGV